MPNAKGLEKFIDMGRVKRWHAVPDTNQTTAEHSWGVALYLILNHPNPSAALLKAAVLHDLHESEFGDVPSHIKDRYPEIAKMEEVEEQLFFIKHGIENPYDTLTPEEFAWLKLADINEAIGFLKSFTNKSAKHYEILEHLTRKARDAAIRLQATYEVD